MVICPKCEGTKIIRNGCPNSKKQQFFCKVCKSYFYEKDSKKYPSTTIPFPIIADLLKFRKMFKENEKIEMPMEDFRKQVNISLVYYQIRDKGCGVSRQTIHYWIRNYSELIENEKLIGHVKNDLKDMENRLYGNRKRIDPKWYKITKRKRENHMEVLKSIEELFGGRERVLEWAKRDKEQFEQTIKKNEYYKLPAPEYDIIN